MSEIAISRARDRISGASRLAERELELRVQSPARDTRDRLEQFLFGRVEEMNEEIALRSFRRFSAGKFAEIFAEMTSRLVEEEVVLDGG